MTVLCGGLNRNYKWNCVRCDIKDHKTKGTALCSHGFLHAEDVHMQDDNSCRVE